MVKGKFDFIVFGATGMQGKIVSRDLLENGYSVLLCGRDEERVSHLLKKYPKKTSFKKIDIKNKKTFSEAIKFSGGAIAINCVEGDWNDEILKICIDSGIHSIDLGSDIPMTKKQLDRKSTRLNSSHSDRSRMPSSA